MQKFKRKTALKPGVGFFWIICCFFILVFQTAPLHSIATGSNFNYPAYRVITIPLPDGSVKGKVSDAKGVAMPGVTVMLTGPVSQTKSADNNGFYNFDHLPAGSYSLTFSYIGFATATRPSTIRPGQAVVLNVALTEAVNEMDKVVVVGYGVQKKATVTGAIVSVGNKELLESPSANITNSLVGRLPGLLATQTSGIPGNDGSTLRIRGTGTFAGGNSADPLVMIDGVETSNFNNLDPNEVDNISILKDASATAVYGLRGANGVILITTKRGKSGPPKVSFTTSLAKTKFISRYKVFDAYNYTTKFNQAYAYDSYLTGTYTPAFTDADIQKYKSGSDPLFYPNTNWIDLMLGKSAPQSTNNLNISGGTDKIKFFTSFGYLTQDGLLKNMDLAGVDAAFGYKRYNFRTNVDFNITKRFTANVSLSSSFENQLGTQDALGNFLSELYKNAPVVGSLTDGRVILNSVNGNYGWTGNPLVFQNSRGRRDAYKNNIIADINLNHTLDFIAKGLSTHIKINYQNYLYNETNYGHVLVTYKPAKVANGAVTYIPQQEDAPFSIGTAFGKTRKTYAEFGLDYVKKIGDHNISAKVLYNQGKLYDPNLAFQVPNGLQGVVGRITYDYKGRYLAEFNTQYNGTENFAPGKRFGFFPAYSAGWVPTAEAFFPKGDIISFLKFRGSYGEVGNDKVGGTRFLYLPSAYAINTSGSPNIPSYRFGEVGSTQNLYAASYEGRIGNPNLTWERAQKSDLGMDMNLFRDKIKINIDLFKEIRNNILAQPQTIPATFGGTSINTPNNGVVINNLPAYNLGKMENKGLEAEVSYDNNIGDFRYAVSANYSIAVNKILFQDEVKRPFSYQNRTGQTLDQFFGLIAEGFYNTWEEVNDANRPVSAWNNNKIQPGDIKYRDVNGDGKINEDDQVPIGFGKFPLQTFGAYLQGSFKGFSVAILFQGARDVTLRSSKQSYRTFQENGDSPTFFEESWSQERYNAGLPINFPHLSTVKDQVHNYQASSYLIRNANYVRLKNLEFGYTLNNRFLKKILVNSARIYFSGSNLILWSHQLQGQDPENFSPPDGNNEVYPAVQVYNLGLNIQF